MFLAFGLLRHVSKMMQAKRHRRTESFSKGWSQQKKQMLYVSQLNFDFQSRQTNTEKSKQVQTCHHLGEMLTWSLSYGIFVPQYCAVTPVDVGTSLTLPGEEPATVPKSRCPAGRERGTDRQDPTASPVQQHKSQKHQKFRCLYLTLSSPADLCCFWRLRG